MKYENSTDVRNFAGTLENMARLAPDEESAAGLYSLVLKLRTRWTENTEQQKDKIFFAIRYKGARTVAELRDDTGLPKDVCEKLLAEMIREKRVRQVKPEGRRASGRGGTTFYYFPIEQ